MKRLEKENECNWLQKKYRKANRGEKTRLLSEVMERLLTVSAPTIDRILRHIKGLKGKSFTRPGGFRDEIPIQEGGVWNIEIPGYFECDTVAHCGGSVAGEFIFSVTMVDVATL